MIGNPEIIILDEPTVGLDPKQILEIRDLIRSMKEKHTIILSSHILSEVAAVCDQVLILSQGKLVASDTTENLSRKMEHKETMKLELTIRGTKAQVEDALQQEDYLELIQCEEKAQETGEECEVVVEAKEGRDIREQLFYLLADKKLPLLKMVPETRSLEDVFLELTEGEGQEEREEQEDDSNI
jgi:ABC-2 type transport system ATP-binding protein